VGGWGWGFGCVEVGWGDVLNLKCVFWKNMSFVRLIQLDIIMNVHRASYMVLVILVRYLMKLEYF